MPTLELRSVDKTFPDGTHAVCGLSFEAGDGELLVLVGPSGCGKTTILRMIAGLEPPSGGEIRIGGQVVDGLPPHRRSVAMVFQNGALYPQMTVRGNLAFPLKMQGRPKAERDARAGEVADLLGLAGRLDRHPGQLSGGQQQRVAMGRAIVRRPDVFLMDEPLSDLDAKLRVQIRAEIARLQRRLETTTIYVTHDQAEAMTLGDRVAVLREGRLQQIGPGPELYDRPANVFVARFLGSPGMNVFSTALGRPDGGPWRLDFGRQALVLPPETADRYAGLDRWADRPLLAGLRPEAFRLASPDAPHAAVQPVRVRAVRAESLGHETLVYFESPVPMAEETPDPGPADGETPPGQMVARLPAGAPLPNPGDELTLAVDCGRVALFDPEGIALPQAAGSSHEIA